MSVLKDALAKLKLDLPPGDAVSPADTPVPYERAAGRVQRAEPVDVKAAPEPPPEEAVRFAAVLLRAAQFASGGGKPEALAADLHRRLVGAGKGTNAARGAWTSVVQSVMDRVKVREMDGELTALNGGRRPEARLTSKGVPTHDELARGVEAALAGGWAVAHLAALTEAQARVKLPVLGENEDEALYLARCEEWAAEQTVAQVRLALGGQTVDSAAWAAVYARRERVEAKAREAEKRARAERARAEAERLQVAQAESERALYGLMVRLRQDDLGDGPTTIQAVLDWEAAWRAAGVPETPTLASRVLAEVLPRRHLVALLLHHHWCASDAAARLLGGTVEVPEMQLLTLPDASLAAIVEAWANKPNADMPLARRAVRVLLDRHGDGYVARVPKQGTRAIASAVMVTEAAADRAPLCFHAGNEPPANISQISVTPSDGPDGYALLRTIHGAQRWFWVSPAAQAARRRLEASLKARGPGSLNVAPAVRAYGRHPEKNYPRLVGSTPRASVYIGIDEAVGRVFDDLHTVMATFPEREIDPRWFLLHARGAKTLKGGWHIYEVRPGQPPASPEAVVFLTDSSSGRAHKRAQTTRLASERGVWTVTSFACEEWVVSLFFTSATEPARLSDGRAISYDPTGETVGASGPTLTMIRGVGSESEAAPVAWPS